MDKLPAESQAQNHFYDGWIYRKLLDPSLRGIRIRISRLIPENSTVLDVGCGTGDQLFFISEQIKSGLGVELSANMINTCQEQARLRKITNFEFLLADASNLANLDNQAFDYAITSMVIHEMSEEVRIPVLKEMMRIGKQLILVDWIYPQPPMLKKFSTHLVERFAGKEHYAGFRSFMGQGGMPALIKTLGLDVVETQITGKGTIQLWVCRTP
ncbi:MAG: class I SAM-dependent methyltransferase [Candidatus Marinimicrobia bacterium]|nr:class I SAM-dependent methyltransferase [Candidatus Neomarinimicrobiota bacterium]